MKKIIATGAILLLIGGGAQALHAEEAQLKTQVCDWALSGYIGVASFDDEDKPDPYQAGLTHEMSSDEAYTVGFIVSKYYNDFSFNLGVEFIQEATVHDEEDYELAQHSHIPVSLGVNYHFNTSLFDPYIGAGVGYSFNDSSESEFINGQGMEMEMDDSVFYYLTAGVEYPLSDTYALFLAGQYVIGDADVTGAIQTPKGTIVLEDESSLDRYEVNLGLKYFF
ncbi:MAG: OmpW family outer membrane protein [Candidatus Electrothrix scaldis]|nr:MAG: OmpW family outer membrane protein [Candidatus Electrothrix sp. GW3-3]